MRGLVATMGCDDDDGDDDDGDDDDGDDDDGDDDDGDDDTRVVTTPTNALRMWSVMAQDAEQGWQ